MGNLSKYLAIEWLHDEVYQLVEYERGDNAEREWLSVRVLHEGSIESCCAKRSEWRKENGYGAETM